MPTNRPWLRSALAVLSVPLLAAPSAYGVYTYLEPQSGPWAAGSAALGYEVLYIGVNILRLHSERLRAYGRNVALAAVATAVVFNTLAHYRATVPDIAHTAVDWAALGLALITSLPLAGLAYAVSVLLHRLTEVSDPLQSVVDSLQAELAVTRVGMQQTIDSLTSELGQARSILAAHRQARQSQQQAGGYVYVIATDQGAHKIGMAVDVAKRVKDLAGMVPHPIEVVVSIATDDRRLLEQRLHECFADRRLRGEWFALTETDLDALMAIGPEVPSDQIDDTIDNLSLVVNMPVSIELSTREDIPEIVRLKDHDKLSFAQIGERLGITRQAAWQQYKAAKRD